MAVDWIARLLAMARGSGNAYTKAEIDALLADKADLANGKVPAAQLPSYVDDVFEYSSTSSFPATGESGKIYVATDTNKTYRWGGSAYVEISESLALGETASTAYPGNKGKANADAIAAIKDGTNIDSFADVETAFAEKLNTSDIDATLSSTSTNPVQNKAVQAPIASLVDRGAKNLLSVNSGSATNGYVFNNLAINLPAGSYVFLANIANYGTRSELVIRSDGSNVGGTAFVNADSVAVQFNITREGTTAELYTMGGTFTNMMLCTAEDYAISPEFVPYAPSNRELYEMILALQSGT